MVLALFSPPGSAEASADFEFTSSSWRGDWNLTGIDQRGLLLVPGGPGADRFGWALDAETMILNWTVVSTYEAARPSDPSNPVVFVEKENPRQWTEETLATRATSHARSNESNLLIVGAPQAPHVQSRAQDLRFGPGPSTWNAGSEQSPTVSGSSGATTRIAFPVPEDFLQAQASNATFRITGNVSIMIWDAEIQLTRNNEANAIQSGRTNKPIAGTSLRETEYMFLRLDAINATVFLEVHDGPARWAAADFHVMGAGSAVFQGAKGVVNDDSGTRMLAGEPLIVAGALSAAFQPDGAHLKLFEGTIEYAAAGRVDPTIPTTTPYGPWSPWLWLALVPIVAMVLFGVRRLRPVTIDEVEWAILAGHERRGLRLARRLVGKTPTNADAVFLYGTTLLARGRLGSLMETIEPLSLRIKPNDRRGIAYILAVAAHASNDARRAQRWAREAAHDPLLREQLEKNGILAVAPSMVQSGYA